MAVVATNTAANTAVGFQSVYDPRLERIILHKKDYTVRSEFTLDPILYSITNIIPLLGVAGTIYAYLHTDGEII